MSASADSLKSILFALVANLLIAIAKLGAALYTGSGAMMAEAIHSFADSGNQGLLIWGLRAAKTPPSPDYPLGFGKAIYFWSFIVALMLFSLGGLFAIYEGVHKLGDPQPVEAPWLAIGVLVFGIVAEAFSLWGCLREINKARGKQSLWAWVRESRQSELVVVLGEDLAALAGLVLALAAVALSMITENPLFDALGSIGIGALLIVVAIFIGVQIKGLLIGKSVEPQVREAIHAQVAADAAVAKVFNIITLQLGNDVMVAIKAQLHCQQVSELMQEINRIEAALKTRYPQIRWCFFEPDFKE